MKRTRWLGVVLLVGALEVFGGAPRAAAAGGGPSAVIWATPDPAGCGQAVHLDGSLSTPGSGTITGYAWDLDGDGITDATGATVTHLFYQDTTVTLTVTDSSGLTATAQQTIDVSTGSYTPTADAGGPYSVVAGGSALALVGSATDPDTACGGGPEIYMWAIDGRTLAESGATVTVPASELETMLPIPTGEFSAYSVQLTVIGATGLQDTATAELDYYRPGFTFDRLEAWPAGFTPNPSVAFTGGAGGVAPNQAVTFIADAVENGLGPVQSYSFDYGDGTSDLNLPASQVEGSGVTHAWASAGRYTVTVTATGGDGQVSPPQSLTVQVGSSPHAPFADPGGPYRIAVGGSVTLDGSGSFDVDTTDQVTSYDWGLPAGAVSGATPTSTLDWSTLSTDLGFTGPGLYKISLTVTDEHSLSETTYTTVEVDPYAPPVSVTADAAAANCGVPVRLQVLDPQLSSGGPLPGYKFVSYVWDTGDGAPIVTTNVPVLQHTYAIDGVTAKAYTATVTVTDDNGRQGNGTVSVAVAGDGRPPVAAAGGPYTVTYGQALTLDASGSTEGDPDCGSDLAFGWDLGSGSYTDASGETPTLSAAAVAALGLGRHVIFLRATDIFGESSTAATTIEVLPAPLAITASSPTTTYGGTVPTITATYSGFVGGDTAASLTTKPTCTTSATSSSPVGTYQTTCSGAADPNYTITYTSGSVTVAPASLSVTASSPSMTYGGALPTITATYSGFVGGDTAASLTNKPTCTTSATSSSPPGTYASSCTGASDPNYTITFDGGSVSVDPAPLSIAASSATMTYGGTVPTITPQITGFVNGDGAWSLATAPTCSTAATSSSPPGTYASSCAGAVDPDYTIGYTPGEVVVGTAVLVVTASSSSTTYGSSPASVTPSYSGFVNGDGSASLTTQPTCSTSASTSSPVGKYATSCSGASDPNYVVTYVPGSVTVTPAPLSVTASSDSTTYGTTPQAVTPSYSGFVGSDSASSLTTPPTCTATATASSPVGSYATSCSGAVDTNYSITYVPGTVAVTPATLTVTGPTDETAYGVAPPAETPGFSGFASSDSAASLTTAPACSADAPAVVAPATSPPAGSYTTTCSGAVDPNYTFSYVPGSLVVEPVPLSITASSAQMTYGGSVPPVSASYAGLVNGDGPGSLGTGLACGTTATSSSPVGSYPTACTGAVDSDYLISYSGGTIDVGPAPLTVTASSATTTYGTAPPAVTASYSGFVSQESPSSLETQPTCSTGAASSSPVGSYASTCSGAVDANYSISYVDGSYTVSPAPLTVTASSGSMTYGGTVPVVTASVSGFANGDSVSSLTTPPSCSTTAASSSPVGPYPTSCQGASGPNYSITYQAGSITVDQAPLTITASTATATYGSTPPAVTAAFSGLVNGDGPSVLGSGLSCSTTDTATSPPGTYPTSCAGALDANYAISYAGGSVVVGAAPLVVIASSGPMTYGGTPPAVTPSYAGFVNGQDASSLSAQPVCSTSATPSSQVGSYPSSCSGASSPNYTITYQSGSVTVNPAPLTITASSATTTYGSTPPAVKATYSGFVNGDTAATLTTAPTCTDAPSSSSPVGVYTTSCSGAYDADYSITYENGTVTVKPAPLTITASSATMSFGSLPPVVTASYSGFVDGDTDSSLTTAPTCTTAATPVSPPGTYPTSCQGAVGSNYTISYVPGTITVTALSATASLFESLAPTGTDLTVSGNGLAVAGPGILDSGSPSALSLSGKAAISLNGVLFSPGGCNATGSSRCPAVTHLSSPAPDPFAALPAPSTAGLAVYAGGANQGCGEYTSTLSVSGNRSTVLNPDNLPDCVYYLEDGFSASGNSVVTTASNGALIYIAGGGFSCSGNAQCTLGGIADGSSPYFGLVIFAARGDTSSLSLSGNATNTYGGYVYAPSSPVVSSGNARADLHGLACYVATVTGNGLVNVS